MRLVDYREPWLRQALSLHARADDILAAAPLLADLLNRRGASPESLWTAGETARLLTLARLWRYAPERRG
jgi:hypothetical protein